MVTDAWAVFVFYGSPNGVTGNNAQTFTQNTPGMPDVAEGGDWFGSTLAVGLYKGGPLYSTLDPLYEALGIGVPEETIIHWKRGAVQVLYGSSSGLTTSGNQLLTHSDFGTGLACWDPTEARFGFALGAADTGGSSESELTVGGVNCGGEIFTYTGGPKGLQKDWHITGYFENFEPGFGSIITGR